MMDNQKTPILLGYAFMASIFASVPLLNVQGQIYEFGYENDHYKVYSDQKKGSDVSVQTIKCANSNVNVNGIDITEIPQDGTATNELQANTEHPNGANINAVGDRIIIEKNLVNVCVNANFNQQIHEPIAVSENLDLAVVNFDDNDVSIRLGNGDGTFTSTAPDVPVGTFPGSLTVGDFNGDSNLDLAVTNAGLDEDLSIRLGNGDGTFTSTAPDVVVGNNPASVAVGEFNGDSNLDLAVVNFGDNDVSIRLGNGDGTFTSTAPDVRVGIQPHSVAVGDFNGDSKMDLAVDNGLNNDVSIRLGNGDGTFTSTAPDVPVGGFPVIVAVGDFNGDSKLDLAVANASDDDLSIRLGNGDGTFTSTAPDVVVGNTPRDIAVGDFNGDSKLDLAVANEDATYLSIRLGNGDGTFTSAPDVGVGDGPGDVAVGDFNRDSKLDLAVANSGDDVSIRLGDGDGTFTSTADVKAGSVPVDIAVGDFDNN